MGVMFESPSISGPLSQTAMDVERDDLYDDPEGFELGMTSDVINGLRLQPFVIDQDTSDAYDEVSQEESKIEDDKASTIGDLANQMDNTDISEAALNHIIDYVDPDDDQKPKINAYVRFSSLGGKLFNVPLDDHSTIEELFYATKASFDAVKNYEVNMFTPEMMKANKYDDDKKPLKWKGTNNSVDYSKTLKDCGFEEKTNCIMFRQIGANGEVIDNIFKDRYTFSPQYLLQCFLFEFYFRFMGEDAQFDAIRACLYLNLLDPTVVNNVIDALICITGPHKPLKKKQRTVVKTDDAVMNAISKMTDMMGKLSTTVTQLKQDNQELKMQLSAIKRYEELSPLEKLRDIPIHTDTKEDLHSRLLHFGERERGMMLEYMVKNGSLYREGIEPELIKEWVYGLSVLAPEDQRRGLEKTILDQYTGQGLDLKKKIHTRITGKPITSTTLPPSY